NQSALLASSSSEIEEQESGMFTSLTSPRSRLRLEGASAARPNRLVSRSLFAPTTAKTHGAFAESCPHGKSGSAGSSSGHFAMVSSRRRECGDVNEVNIPISCSEI